MTRTTARLGRLAGALIAGTLVLTGCADDTAGHNGHTTGSDASTTSSASTEASFNDADVAFATGMLPHHDGAIAMSELAAGRAADPRVLDLASRIEAAQTPEIDTLTTWLTEWGVDDTSGAHHDGMDHGADDMGGMMSEEDMTALANASGAEFDRLFLTQMIEHHRGATAMAEREAADGQNADALAMAENIRDTQNAEIAEMQTLLTELGG
jgi:uncharacterized protein (DUF305 family)